MPTIPSSLRIVKLTPTTPPEKFLRETLGKLGVEPTTIQPLARTPHLLGKGLPESLVGVVEHEQLRAYWNRQTGTAEIFPQFDKLTGTSFERQSSPQLTRAVSLAKEVFVRQEILPHDATEFTVGDARPVLGANAQRDSQSKPEPQLYLTYVPAFRTVRGYKVYGIGSRAVIAMANDGSIHGFLRRWKPGTLAGVVRETRSSEQIRAALLKMLEPMARNSDVQVLAAEVAYYDGDEQSMVPVYRVLVHLRSHEAHELTGAPNTMGDLLVARYLAYGNTRLPAQLTPGTGPMPKTVPSTKIQKREPPNGDPLVGRYVVHDAEWGFVDEANAFWNGLSFFFGSNFFTNSQYYWATPGMYIGGENTFVNSVNVALTEAHGSNWSFTTKSNCCDVVNISSIPANGGYGAAAGGRLDYWIIHSCSVVPSAADRSDWPSPWWDVFQGLHSVVGSRTEMLFDSGAVNFPFGMNLRFGASVVSAWFNANLSYYSGQPPYDRPSTISVCGRANDSVYNTDALPAAGCLVNFWQPN